MESVSCSLPIAKLRESKFNPRQDFGDMEGLTSSVKEKGILQPLLVRPLNGPVADPNLDWYEVVAGARRLRASVAAGLDHVPVIIRGMSNVEAEQICMLENLQRADIHPMDEAIGLQNLARISLGPSLNQDLRKQDVAEHVARLVGKTRTHVLRRAHLLNLEENARAAFRAGKITADVAAVLARLPEKQSREKATAYALKSHEQWDHHAGKHVRQLPSAAEVNRFIRDEVARELKSCGFDTTATKLVPAAGACSDCPKRTGAQASLFGEGSSKGEDRCLDPPCFKSKLDATWQIRTEEAKKKGVQVLAPEASAKVFDKHDNVVIRNSGYVSVGDDDHSTGWKPYRTFLGKDAPPVVIAQDREGKIQELYVRTELEAAVRAKTKTPQRKSSVDTSARNERQARKLALVVARRQALLASEAAPKATEAQFLRAVLELHLDSYLNDWDKAVLKDLGVSSVAELRKSSDVGMLRRALIRFEIRQAGIDGWAESRAKKIAPLLGVDTKEIQRQAKDKLLDEKTGKLKEAAAAKAPAKKKKGSKR